MEFLNPVGRDMEGIAPRTCICSTMALRNLALTMQGNISCNNCNCQCSSGTVNLNANFNLASARRHV